MPSWALAQADLVLQLSSVDDIDFVLVKNKWGPTVCLRLDEEFDRDDGKERP